jgi:hypothetical protein
MYMDMISDGQATCNRSERPLNTWIAHGYDPGMRIQSIAIAVLLVSSPAVVPAADSGDGWRTVEFHGIRPVDPGGRDGLRNPERGLRIETLFAEPDGGGAWGPAHHLAGKMPPVYSESWWTLDARRYEPHGLTLAQTYCYLDGFADAPISEAKLLLLDRSLDRVRREGLKAVLRFAYEKDTERRGGPTLDRILSHIEQLKPLIRKHAGAIFVLQAGFVGAWGEWHSSTRRLEEDHGALAAIVAAVLDALPPDRMTQVRVPKYKRWVLSRPPFAGGALAVDARTAHGGTPAARIGFHDDGFLAGNSDGGTWTEGPRFAAPGNPEFDGMTAESPFVPVDGELFWSDQGGKIDGLRAAVRLRLHHYSSFSLAHSYSEREGKPFSIDDWMRAPLTAAQAREARLPVSDGWFDDGAGGESPRTAFEYIRDHLGYRLELRTARFPGALKAGEPVSVRIEIVNRGFAAPCNPRPVVLALIGADERVAPLPSEGEGIDPRRWQPHTPGDPEFRPIVHGAELRARVPADLAPGRYSLGLWLPDAAPELRLDARYTVRLANRDAPWWTDREGHYGIHLLGIVEVRRQDGR